MEIETDENVPLATTLMLGRGYIGLKKKGHYDSSAEVAMREIRKLHPKWFEKGGVFEDWFDGREGSHADDEEDKPI